MKTAKAEPKMAERRRLGRPTKEEAQQLTERIIEVATPIFLKGGYEATSIDSIVSAALISKQTFYSRFVSKEALFSAVIRKRMNDLLLPVVRGPSAPSSIEAVLVQIATELTKRSLAPTAIAIDRLVAAESHQFPQLAVVYRDNTVHVTDLIADIFSNAMANGEIKTSDSRFLAEQFRYAVIDGPTKMLVLGHTKTKAEDWRKRLVKAVKLFLHGCLA